MRKLILTLLMFLPTLSFALSCPNNGRILDTGYSIEQVLSLCGQPISTKHYPVTTHSMEEWTYYKSTVNNLNNRITILVSDRRVANINILANAVEQNFSSTNACGVQLQAGDDAGRVLSACGNPASRRTLNSSSEEITRFTYTGAGYQVLVFVDGKLNGWAYLD